jgi:hypothetical protein
VSVMTTYWFKPKRYGYGATPTTWQGWAVTLGAVALMVAVSLSLQLNFRSFWSLVGLVAFDVIVLATMTFVAYTKTEGGWHWRWGRE